MSDALTATTPVQGRRYFYAWHVGLPLLLGLMVFALLDLGALDLRVADALYDANRQQFVLQYSALAQEITFRWTRLLPDTVEKLAQLGALVSMFWPLYRTCTAEGRHAGQLGRVLRRFADHRRDFFYVVASFIACTYAIQFLKIHTGVECPVRMARYGGVEAQLDWWRQFTWWHEAGKGRCWPGGHAATAFNLLALYFVARCHRWRHATALLVAVLLLATAYGGLRVLQGWHLASHGLWSGLVVWACALVLALVFYGPKALEQH